MSQAVNALKKQHAEHVEATAGSVCNEAAVTAQLKITELKQKLKITEQKLQNAEAAAKDAKQQACDPQ